MSASVRRVLIFSVAASLILVAFLVGFRERVVGLFRGERPVSGSALEWPDFEHEYRQGAVWVVVENPGSLPLRDLRLTSASVDGESVSVPSAFGEVGPGGRREFSVPVGELGPGDHRVVFVYEFSLGEELVETTEETVLRVP